MDEEAKRQVLRRLPYGMYIMTAIAGGKPAASTLTWLSQCSFRPPLVMIAIQKTSAMHEAVERSGAPLLTDVPAWFEVRVSGSVERGDHTVFVAEVVNAGVRDAAAKPLLLASTPWNYSG